MSRIEEIREREKAATPGPWETCDGGKIGVHVSQKCGDSCCHPIAEPEEDGRDWEHWYDVLSEINNNNAYFIANARADVPFLLRVVELMAMSIEQSDQPIFVSDKGFTNVHRASPNEIIDHFEREAMKE